MFPKRSADNVTRHIFDAIAQNLCHTADFKIVSLKEFFEGLEISSATKIRCNSVENMTRNIICGPLREHTLFAYPTNFTANFENNLH